MGIRNVHEVRFILLLSTLARSVDHYEYQTGIYSQFRTEGGDIIYHPVLEYKDVSIQY